MRTFDPSRPAAVHDHLNRQTFEWRPEWQASYQQCELDYLGVSNWDGLQLNGWRPIVRRRRYPDVR
jgi:hypothetical protein